MPERRDDEIDCGATDRPPLISAGRGNGQSSAVRKRSALPITVTELIAITALAFIGLSSSPNTG